jgi:hypothetical protein
MLADGVEVGVFVAGSASRPFPIERWMPLSPSKRDPAMNGVCPIR